jgi:hypothetical protein
MNIHPKQDNKDYEQAPIRSGWGFNSQMGYKKTLLLSKHFGFF